MRNNLFLEDKLDEIWKRFFPDVPKRNNVYIKFGKKARKRLGSIRERYINNSNDFDTLIMINGNYKNEKFPEFLIDATIAHELCHYAHGFASPLPRLSRFPHRGGSVDQEMLRRGMGPLLDKEQDWLDENWINSLTAAA